MLTIGSGLPVVDVGRVELTIAVGVENEGQRGLHHVEFAVSVPVLAWGRACRCDSVLDRTDRHVAELDEPADDFRPTSATAIGRCPIRAKSPSRYNLERHDPLERVVNFAAEDEREHARHKITYDRPRISAGG